MEIVVRAATEADCPRIAPITDHEIRTGWAHFGTGPDDPASVAARALPLPDAGDGGAPERPPGCAGA